MSSYLKNVTIKSHEMTRPKPPIIVGTGSLGKVYKVQYKGTDAIIKSAKVKKKKKNFILYIKKKKIYLFKPDV
jgi:predicted Ser/Thr protein kinase